MDTEEIGRQCKTAPATPLRRSSSASHQQQIEEQELAPKAPCWSANRVTRSRSTSALTCLSLASKASLQSAGTATTTTLVRKILTGTKSEISQPALDTHLTKASELSPPPTSVTRSRSSSSATALSDLLDATAAASSGTEASCTTPKRFALSASLSLLSPSLSSSKSSTQALNQPQTPASPHSRASFMYKHALSPSCSTPPSSALQTSQGLLAVPMKRSRSSTMSSFSDYPRKSPPPRPLRHVTSHTMLSLNSLFHHKEHGALPAPLATSLPILHRGPTSPLKTAFKPEIAQSGGSTSPDSFSSSSTVQAGSTIQTVCAPVTPLTPTHLPHIDRITVSYFAAATCASECKRLVLSFRRLSAPLPLATQCINTPGNSGRTVKVVTQLREKGPNKIEVMYRDGYRLCFDPEDMPLDQMLSRIRIHAEEMASAFACPS